MRGPGAIRTAAIHQPDCFPWLGFIHKALAVDVFVLMDDVQFEKNGFQNRNRIRTADGWAWLTVPVGSAGSGRALLQDIEVSTTGALGWRRKHLASWRQNYAGTAFQRDYMGFLESLYARDSLKLVDFNIAIIKELFAAFGVTAEVVRSSDLRSEGVSSERLLSLCKAVGAGRYLSGIAGENYLDETIFREQGIDVIYQDFHHPVYDQKYKPFIPNMSAFDLLFNRGNGAREFLMRSHCEQRERVRA